MALSASVNASLLVVSPLNTRLPPAPLIWMAQAGTTWLTGSGVKVRAPRVSCSLICKGSNCSHGASGTGYFTKVRPHVPVEHVLRQHFEHLGQRMHNDGRGAHFAHGIEQQRQAQHVIKMGMGQDHMVDRQQFIQAQGGDTGAGVDQDVVIDLEAGGVAPAADAAAAAEYGQFHRCSCRAYLVV